jgi:hypothetical protein
MGFLNLNTTEIIFFFSQSKMINAPADITCGVLAIHCDVCNIHSNYDRQRFQRTQLCNIYIHIGVHVCYYNKQNVLRWLRVEFLPRQCILNSIVTVQTNKSQLSFVLQHILDTASIIY